MNWPEIIGTTLGVLIGLYLGLLIEGIIPIPSIKRRKSK